MRYTFDWDWAGAENEFRRALELAPNSAAVHQRYAFFLTCLAHFDEALAEARRAVELDPLTASTRIDLSWVYMSAGRYEESLHELGKIRELQLSAEEYPLESWNQSFLGRYDTALAQLEQKPTNPLTLATRGWILAQAGQLSEARELRREIERQASETAVDPYALAIVYAGLGETDLALEALEDGYSTRSSNMIFLKVEPFFQSLRSDPRYGELLWRVPGLHRQLQPGNSSAERIIARLSP